MFGHTNQYVENGKLLSAGMYFILHVLLIFFVGFLPKLLCHIGFTVSLLDEATQSEQT